MELSDTDSEISLIELIRNIPADRAKLSSLLNQGMEEAETVQHLLQGWL